MSTDQTPIDRAADELMGGLPGLLPFIAGPFAHAILSASLTNDADPDWLARVIYEHFPHGRLTVSGEAETVPWGEVSTWKQDQVREAADAVRAALLGGDAWNFGGSVQVARSILGADQ